MRLSDGICKICLAHTEDFEHMVSKCQGINRVWALTTELIHKIVPNLVLTKEHMHFGLMSDDLEVNTLTNTILSITRWQIWKRRCTNKYDKKLIPIESCLSNIKSDVQEHMKILHKKSKYRDKAGLILT